MTYEAMSKFYPVTQATAFGHMQQERRNLQSTKESNIKSDYFPAPESPKTKTNEIFIKITPFKPTQKEYSDLTGRFPYTSSQGNQYFVVVYDYNSNAILVKVIKSRNGTEIKNAYMKIVVEPVVILWS